MNRFVALLVVAMPALRGGSLSPTSAPTNNPSSDSSDLLEYNDTNDSLVQGMTMVDVQGQSGKFTVYNSKAGRSKGITVTMDALREIDVNDNAVGASGSVKHSLNTFASQDFTIEDGEKVTIGTASATKITFSSPISTIGMIKVDTFVMSDSGKVGPPGEMWDVAIGDLKWNIELSQWSWCGCAKGQTTETGAFIDVDISVKGLGSSALKGGSNKSLDIGDGLSMELSDQVKVDGEWTSMPEGYPKIEIKGSSMMFTFRFPKFETSATYDPLIQGMASLAEPEDATAKPTSMPTSMPSSPLASDTLGSLSSFMLLVTLLPSLFGHK